jgi:CRP-like cAMP-binding protein
MRLEAATSNTVRPNAQPIRLNPASPEMFAGCPELIGTPFTYDRETEIYGEGENAEFVYRIVSGAVRTCKILADGRRQINAFHLAGDLFGFEPGEAHRLTAEAIVDTKVHLFRRRQVQDLANRNVEAARRLWNATLQNLEDAEDHMLLLGRRTALERVAAFLLSIEKRLGGKRSVDLPMSRRDIADYLGLTIETVSRSMTQLQNKRAIALSGARHLVVDMQVMNRYIED